MSWRGAALCALLLACNGQLRFQDAPDTGAPAPPPPCHVDHDCGHGPFHCDTVSHRCVSCRSDADCAATGAPRCDVALHRCVECGADLDCASGQSCEPATRRCVIACDPRQPGHVCPATEPTCSEAFGFCTQCQVDGDCQDNTDEGPYCEPAIGRCVQCADDHQCPPATPRCDRTRGRCSECTDSDDCPVGKVCDLAQLHCV